MMRRRFSVIAIIIIVCLLFTGCGAAGSIYANYRAMEALQPVQTLGLDPDGGAIALTVCAGGQGDAAEPLVLSGRGVDLLHAMDAAQDAAPEGQLFFSHAQDIVFGRDFAENGIGSVLDFVERDVHLRLDTALFVLRGGDAGALISDIAAQGFDIAEQLESVRRDTELRGDSHVFTFRETAVALSEYGAAPVCALGEQDSVALPLGYAILRGDRLAGFLEGSTAEAASLLLGHLGSVVRSIPCGDGLVTLEVSGRAEMRAVWNPDGTPAPLTVRATLSAVIAGQPPDAAADSAALTEALCSAFRKDLSAALHASQTMDADYLAIAGVLRRSDPQRFAALPPDWLQQLDFDVDVTASLVHSYDLGAPLTAEGGGT